MNADYRGTATARITGSRPGEAAYALMEGGSISQYQRKTLMTKFVLRR
jgi:hypothetical protein